MYAYDLYSNDDARRVAEMVRGNTVLRELSLSLCGRLTADADCESLQQFLRSSPSLTIVQVHTADKSNRGLQIVADRLVTAASQNKEITAIILCTARISTRTLASMKVKELSFYDLEIESVVHQQESRAEQIEAAFRGNVMLEQLSVQLKLGRDVLLPILRALFNHPKLKVLKFEGPRPLAPLSHEDTRQMQTFLETSNSPKHISFGFLSFRDTGPSPVSFQWIACGLRERKTAAALTLETCSFDQASTEHFESMFQTPSCVTTLELKNEVRFAKPAGNLLRDLLRQSNLKKLELGGRCSWDATCVQGIGEALKQDSSLTSLVIRCRALDEPLCQEIMNSLPAWRGLRSIVLVVNVRDITVGFVACFLRAFQRNGSLTTIDIDAEFLDRQARAALRSYADRNDKSQRLCHSPSAVPVNQWPETLARAMECENWLDVVYTVFRASPNFVLRARRNNNNETAGDGLSATNGDAQADDASRGGNSGSADYSESLRSADVLEGMP